MKKRILQIITVFGSRLLYAVVIIYIIGAQDQMEQSPMHSAFLILIVLAWSDLTLRLTPKA